MTQNQNLAQNPMGKIIVNLSQLIEQLHSDIVIYQNSIKERLVTFPYYSDMQCLK